MARDEPNAPAAGMSEWATRAITSAGSRFPGYPVTSAYRKPWMVKRGSKTWPPAAVMTSSAWRADLRFSV